ncbi:MAG TPA: hypothetical protein VFI06_16450 [Chitinophagaceae bacterium]|nr:hypothetical protein [Chitinophagaceae bacterium]
MKNFIVATATVLATALSPVFANGSNDNPQAAKKVFAKEFVGAQNIKWSELHDGYQKVTFVLNGTAAETYFDAEGELLGTIRNLLYNQLPLAVMQKVNNKFNEGVILVVNEITNPDGTTYQVTLEQKNRKYNVRLNSLGEVIGVQKEKIKK